MVTPVDFVSNRGFPLVCRTEPRSGRSTITVESYCKWYSLFLVTNTKSGPEVKVIDFADLEPYTDFGEAAYVDHVPNPRVVAKFCRIKDYDICLESYEIMVGRWELEVKNNPHYANWG